MTGVQTCALPIWQGRLWGHYHGGRTLGPRSADAGVHDRQNDRLAPLHGAGNVGRHRLFEFFVGQAFQETPPSRICYAFDAWLKDPFNIPPINILPTTSDIGYIHTLEGIGFRFEDALRQPVWQDRGIANENIGDCNRLASTLAIHDAVSLVRSEQHNASGQGPLTQSALEAFRPFMAPAASSGSIRDVDRYGSPYYRPRAPGGRK